jgi:hypothetical protein
MHQPVGGGRHLRSGDGDDLHLVGSRFDTVPRYAATMLAPPPPVIHIQRPEERSVLRWSIDQMMLELADARPGASLVGQPLERVCVAGWSSPVARQAHNLNVTGSNPVPATKNKQ